MVRIGINGFGRIGRNVLRAARDTTAEEVNSAFQAASEGSLKGSKRLVDLALCEHRST